MTAKHHYIIETYPDGWAFGRCKWCKCIKPFRNWPSHDINGRVIPTTARDKRNFLRSINIKIYKNHWEPDEKDEIKQSVRRIGIHQTAKKFGLAPSTVGLWAKGLSPHAHNVSKYTPEFKEKMVVEYKKEPNFYKLAKKTGIPRATIQSWVKKALKVQN